MLNYHAGSSNSYLAQVLPSAVVFDIAIRLSAAILAAAVHKSDGVRLQGELFWPCFLRENLR
jgi:hypothetical protein